MISVSPSCLHNVTLWPYLASSFQKAPLPPPPQKTKAPRPQVGPLHLPPPHPGTPRKQKPSSFR